MLRVFSIPSAIIIGDVLTQIPTLANCKSVGELIGLAFSFFVLEMIRDFREKKKKKNEN